MRLTKFINFHIQTVALVFTLTKLDFLEHAELLKYIDKTELTGYCYHVFLTVLKIGKDFTFNLNL